MDRNVKNYDPSKMSLDACRSSRILYGALPVVPDTVQVLLLVYSYMNLISLSLLNCIIYTITGTLEGNVM